MQWRFKRTWIERGIVLSGLAGTAHFLAVGVVTLIGGALPLPSSPEAPAVALAAAPVLDPCALLAHQSFDASLGAMPCEEVEATEEVLPPSLTTELAACDDVPRRLVGTVVERERAHSFAAIVDATGHASLLEEGSLSGDATVARIDPESVILERGETRCVLSLFTEEPTRAVAPSAPPLEILASRATPISDTRARIDRAMVDQLFADPSALLGMVRLVPHQEGGAVLGMRAYGLRSGSLLSNLGLRNGDTLRSVNGVSVANTGLVFDALMQLRSARSLEVLIDREGAPLTLHVDID